MSTSPCIRHQTQPQNYILCYIVLETSPISSVAKKKNCNPTLLATKPSLQCLEARVAPSFPCLYWHNKPSAILF